MQEYFRNIYQTVRTILAGMRVTLRYCFARTVTLQYPDMPPALAPRFRGIHYLEVHKCIACGLCARACPVDCIHIQRTAPRKVDKASGNVVGGAITRFAIDYGRCMLCALCVEPCPQSCLHMGNVHSMTTYDHRSTIVEFAELARQGLQTPMPLWAQMGRLPEWAARQKQEWLDRAAPVREKMLAALTTTAPAAPPKPAGPSAGAGEGADKP
jgi:NADH-quinone oxidoreductase subunit I